MAGLHVGVVGLRFGSDFVPIYQHHPDVARVSIVDTDAARLEAEGERFGVVDRYRTLEELLEGADVDAVHLVTPVAFHAAQVQAVLGSGRHCACAVPMATTLEDMQAIVAAQKASGRVYMMMETTVFGREYLYVRSLLEDGTLGELTFYRGFHLQDLDGYPSYWMGYPPMHYITHALSPALALTGRRTTRVRGLGSGRLSAERSGSYGNPFPLEVALFELADHPMVADITMSFFQTGRAYTEGFAVYGTEAGAEWPAAEEGPLLVHRLGPVGADSRGRSSSTVEVQAPDRPDLLPASIARFTRPCTLETAHGSVRVGAAHGGSHPHLVHEFVRSIVEDRRPLVDAPTAATWSAPGVCAHRSALAGGDVVDVPDFGAPGGG